MDRRARAAATLARRSPLAIAFFDWQFRRQLREHFNAVRLSLTGPAPVLPSGPVVFYSNHPSWWEAVVYFYLGRTLFRDRVGYGPVEQAQLDRYPMLDRLGLFGVDLNSYGGASQFLMLAQALFARPDTMLWVTAEGTFTDPRARPIRLAPGISHLAFTSPMLSFVPLAIDYTFWNQKNPELLLRFGTPIMAATWKGRRKALHAALEQTLGQNLDALQTESALRDPARFMTLMEGRSGISLTYDLSRRIAAWLRRERYTAKHRT